LRTYSTRRIITLRTMDDISLLGFALLGLLHQQPMSGYDLRKVFATSAMGSFSDSPGAIYPALKRLEARGLVRGTVETSTGLRQRRMFRNTVKGQAALKAWLRRPLTLDDVIRRLDELMLRFSFMDRTLGESRSVAFLQALVGRIADYIPSLQQYLEAHAPEMPRSGRLALECGVYGYEAQLKWAKAALSTYERRREGRK
jgi:DNA-binding PadR family transcriptional regulator